MNHDDQQAPDADFRRAHRVRPAEGGGFQRERPEKNRERRDRHHRSERHAQEATGHPFRAALVARIDVTHESRDKQRGEQRSSEKAVVDEVGQRVGKLVGVPDICGPQYRADDGESRHPGDAAHNRPGRHGQGVTRGRGRLGQLRWPADAADGFRIRLRLRRFQNFGTGREARHSHLPGAGRAFSRSPAARCAHAAPRTRTGTRGPAGVTRIP